MSSQIDLRDLKYFETIAELGHLGRAAKQLCRTQPTLTGCVRRMLSGQPGKCIGYTVAFGHAQLGRVWEMRKKAVGLLGNVEGEARPIPFVEDTAVPPENLADYIMQEVVPA